MNSSTPPSPELQPQSPRTGGVRRSSLFLLAVVVLIVAGGGIFERVREGHSLNRSTQAEAIPTVVVIKASRGAAAEDIALPGNVQAWHEAPIYARTSGYLKDWKTDIGASVKAGDVLAEIETPEVDAQLHQAEADLATARANNDLAQSTARRWADLLKTHAVSKQDADDKAGAAAAGAAAEASAAANADRLRQLEGFKQIVAPFDGTITARNTDTGALINAGSSGAGPELFHIAETDKLRVYVEVPQTYASAITPDIAAELRFAEHPGKTYPATLTHTADALNAATRTLTVELEVDNAGKELLPGGYAEVHLKIPSPNAAVRLPGNTLLFRAQGLQVATVDNQGRARLKDITVGRDYGATIEVTAGVEPDEPVIVNPPDSLVDGQQVRVAAPATSAGGKNEQSAGGKGEREP